MKEVGGGPVPFTAKVLSLMTRLGGDRKRMGGIYNEYAIHTLMNEAHLV